MSRCCRIWSRPMSMFAFTPRTPIVPSMLGIKPGTAMVNCHGSLWVIVGGAVSLGCSSSVPAATEPMNADAAPANKKNRSFMCRVLNNAVLIGKRDCGNRARLWVVYRDASMRLSGHFYRPVESLNRRLLRQPAFVPQSRDYSESRGFGGLGNRAQGEAKSGQLIAASQFIELLSLSFFFPSN